MTDFSARLPQLLTRAISWAEAMSKNICLLRGIPLNANALALARAVGVTHPDRIRVWTVARIPAPDDPELKRFAIEQNLLGPATHGTTLGYGICVLHGHATPRLLSHEFRHVYQYEQAGSIDAFLTIYLKQIAEYTYAKAPYEIDARAHEHSAYPDD